MTQSRWVFGAVIFLGAFLLFLLEPMAAKALLPSLGGSSAVWITCLVFFQAMLLLGYLYAHWLSRSGPASWKLHLLLVGFSVIALAGSFGTRVLGDTAHPVAAIFRTLSVRIGLPFLLLGSTSPLLQVWIARAEGGRVRYSWFGLSNLGSLLGLIAYPIFVEPNISLHRQQIGWVGGFIVYAAMMAWIVLANTSRFRENLQVLPQHTHIAGDQSARPTPPSSQGMSSAQSPSGAYTRAMWFLLPMGASMQFAAVTSHLTVNIAAIPLLWMLPLAAYLVSFILAFDLPWLYRRAIVGRFVAVMLAGLGYALTKTVISYPIIVGVPFFLLELFAASWFCHAEVYRLRPLADQATEFYLLLAAGGVVGTCLIAIVSPLVFSANYDLGLAFAVTATLALVVTWNDGWGQRLLWGVGSVLLVIVVVLLHIAYQRDMLQVARNFYGTLRVTQKDSPAGPVRTLANGTIQHGTQIFPWQQPGMERVPTTYYAEDSGIGLALRSCCNDRGKRVGVIGLGIGTLAAYGQPGDLMRFYEINPLVRPLGERWFTYLKDSHAAISFADGDGRTSLASEAPQDFDIIVVDAFSGDAIPVHLLTVEAIQQYRKHLAKNGVIAFHVSNQYLNLAPEIEALATASGMQARLIESAANAAKGEYRATWVLVANASYFDRGGFTGLSEPIQRTPGVTAWTDDYSSLLPLIDWGGH